MDALTEKRYEEYVKMAPTRPPDAYINPFDSTKSPLRPEFDSKLISKDGLARQLMMENRDTKAANFIERPPTPKRPMTPARLKKHEDYLRSLANIEARNAKIAAGPKFDPTQVLPGKPSPTLERLRKLSALGTDFETARLGEILNTDGPTPFFDLDQKTRISNIAGGKKPNIMTTESALQELFSREESRRAEAMLKQAELRNAALLKLQDTRKATLSNPGVKFLRALFR